MDDSPEVRIAEALESIAEALGILAVGAGRCRSATSPLPCLHTWGAVGVGPRGCPGHQCREPRDHRGDHVCAWCDAVDAPRVSVQAPDRLRAVMEQHAAAKPIVSVCNPFDPEEARVRKLQTELNERLAREQRMADAREAAGSPVSPQPPGAVGAAPLTADDINAVNAPGSIAETFRGKVHVRRPGETWAYFQERIRASPVVGGAVPEFARCPFEWAAVDTLQCRLSSKRHRCELPAGHGGGLHQCGACSVSVPVVAGGPPPVRGGFRASVNPFKAFLPGSMCDTTWEPEDERDSSPAQCGADSHQCNRKRGHIGRHECLCGKRQVRASDVRPTGTMNVGRVHGHTIPPMSAATANTQPTRCLTQWPWGAVFADDGGGACGPDATVGGLRSECHHRCCAAVGHQGLCRCECGKLRTEAPQTRDPTICGYEWHQLANTTSEERCGCSKPNGGDRTKDHHRCYLGPGHTGLCCCGCGAGAQMPTATQSAVPTWRPIDSLSKSIPGGWKLFLCQGSPLLLTSHEGWAPPDATHWCPLPVMP